MISAKKKFLILLTIISLLYAKYYFTNKNNRILNILAWHNSLNYTIVEKFEKEYKIKINLKLYSTNEELLSLIRFSKEYIDIIFPSDYIFPELLKLNLIKPIKIEKIKNFLNIAKIHFKPIYYNKQYYAIPNEWNVIGLIINEKVKKLTNRDPKKVYELFFNGTYKNYTARVVQMVDILMLSNLVYNYYKNIFLKDKDRICIKNNLPTIIFEILKKQKKYVTAYTEESVLDLFKYDVIDIALAESDRYLYMKHNNPELNLSFVLPPYYILKVTDFFAIAASSKNDDLCYEFINFCLEKDQLELKRDNNFSFLPLKNIDPISLHEQEISDYVNNHSKYIYFTDHIVSKKDILGIQTKIRS